MSSLVLPHSRLLTALPLARTAACLALLAAMPFAQAARHYPKAIKDALANGAKVVRTFPAASGLTGWVLAENGNYSLAYTTADNKTVILGNLINEKGENLTELYAEKYFPKPDRSALFKQLEQSAYIADGTLKHPKSVLYVFTDVSGPYFPYIWKALLPYRNIGLQVRWMLVAPRPASMPKAIEVLDAADPAAALRKMEEGSGKQRSLSLGLSEPDRPDLAEKVRGNTRMMEEFGITHTPGIVWKDHAGKVQVKSGMPRLSLIPKITGLPLQETDDPELAKFK